MLVTSLLVYNLFFRPWFSTYVTISLAYRNRFLYSEYLGMSIVVIVVIARRGCTGWTRSYRNTYPLVVVANRLCASVYSVAIVFVWENFE